MASKEEKAARKARRRKSHDAHSKSKTDGDKQSQHQYQLRRHSAPAQQTEQDDVQLQRDAGSIVKKMKRKQEASRSWSHGVPAAAMEAILQLLEPIDRQQFRATCKMWRLAGCHAVKTQRFTFIHKPSMQLMGDVNSAFWNSRKTQLRVHPSTDPAWLQHGLGLAVILKTEELQLLPPLGKTAREAAAIIGDALKGLIHDPSNPVTPSSALTSLDLRGFTLSAAQLEQLAQIGRVGQLRKAVLRIGVLDTDAVAQLLQLKALEELDCMFETFDPAYVMQAPKLPGDLDAEASTQLKEQHYQNHITARRAMLGCCVGLLALPNLSRLSLSLPALHNLPAPLFTQSSDVAGGPFNSFVQQLAAMAYQIRRMESLTVRTASYSDNGSLLEESKNRAIGYNNLTNKVQQEVSVTAPASFAAEPDNDLCSHEGALAVRWSCFVHSSRHEADSVLGVPPELTDLTLTRVMSADTFSYLGPEYDRGQLKHLRASLFHNVWSSQPDYVALVDMGLEHLGTSVPGLQTLELYPTAESMECGLPVFTDKSIARLAESLTQLVTLKLHGVLATQLAGSADPQAWKTPAVTQPFSTYDTSATTAVAADATAAHSAPTEPAAAAAAAAAAGGSGCAASAAAAAPQQLAFMPGKNEQRSSWRLLASLSELRSLSLGHLGKGKEVLLSSWLPKQLTSLELRGIAITESDPAPSLRDLRCLRLQNCQMDTVAVFGASPLTELAVTKHPYPLTLRAVAAAWPALDTLRLHDGTESFVDLQALAPLSQLTRLRSLALGLETSEAMQHFAAMLGPLVAATQVKELQLQLSVDRAGQLTSYSPLLSALEHLHSLTVSAVCLPFPAMTLEVSIVGAILRTCMQQTDVMIQLSGHDPKHSPDLDAAMYSVLAAASAKWVQGATYRVPIRDAARAALGTLPDRRGANALLAAALKTL